MHRQSIWNLKETEIEDIHKLEKSMRNHNETKVMREQMLWGNRLVWEKNKTQVFGNL